MGRRPFASTAKFMSSSVFVLLLPMLLLLGIQSMMMSDALVTPQPIAKRPSTTTTTTATRLFNAQQQPSGNTFASTVFATFVWIGAAASWDAASITSSSSPYAAHAFVPSDYASETVQQAVQSLKDGKGDVDATFKAYENIAAIITEGKGVGGMVNFKGVQLERGFVADEDTSIYNPGLTLLTESEKERLVDAIIENRKVGLSTAQWSENNEYGYEFLKGTLDPLHMYELEGFLGFVPIYGAVLYLGVLFVQQNLRNLFPQAYLVGVVAFFGPIIALIAAGP